MVVMQRCLFNLKIFSVRLSDRYGDIGRGTLEVYKPDIKLWVPACINDNWDHSTSPSTVCTMLGYSSVNSSKLIMRETKLPMSYNKDTQAMWRSSQKKHSNILKQFNSCPVNGNYQTVDLTCTNYGMVQVGDSCCSGSIKVKILFVSNRMWKDPSEKTSRKNENRWWKSF